MSTVRQRTEGGKSPLAKGHYLLFFLTALAVIAADQATKLWIRSYPEGQVILKTKLFNIIHITNTGAAFGFLQDQNLFLTVVAFVGIALILLFVFFFSRRLDVLNTASDRFILGLILGGTIGNLIDRLRFGQVTDFVSVGIFPLFNVADSAVTVGVIFFVYLFLTYSKANKPLAQ